MPLKSEFIQGVRGRLLNNQQYGRIAMEAVAFLTKEDPAIYYEFASGKKNKILFMDLFCQTFRDDPRAASRNT